MDLSADTGFVFPRIDKRNFLCSLNSVLRCHSGGDAAKVKNGTLEVETEKKEIETAIEFAGKVFEDPLHGLYKSRYEGVGRLDLRTLTV